jgi:ammonium transporter Rh
MVGTVFLFMYWPSFNGALAVGMAQQRAAINTLLSICTSTMVAVYVSRALTGKIDMEVMLNATLAGGVVMGASCDLIIGPGFAMIAGFVAGVISAVGFLKLNAICKEKIGLHDTCGIQFLHGIPGTLGGFVSAITVAAGTYNFENDMQIKALMPAVAAGRSVQIQACY